MRPLPGIGADVVDNEGKPVPERRRRVPRADRAVAGDDCAASGATTTGYKETYWSRFAEQGFYFAGDGAKKDEDGDLWLLGRVDDVMNVSGHRISTTEVESALVSHPSVAEAAVVGATDPTTGQGIVAFVILRGSGPTDEAEGEQLVKTLRDHVAKEIGADRQAAPDHDRARSCRRPAPARSCAGCCATSPSTASSATSRRSTDCSVMDLIGRSCPAPSRTTDQSDD